MPRDSVVIDSRHRVDVIDDLQDLHAIADPWDRILLESAHCSPMLSYSWVSAYLETMLAECEQWRCFLLFRNDMLIAIVPLITRTEKRIGVRHSRGYTPYNSHSYSGGMVSDRSIDGDILTEYFNAIIRFIRPKVSTIVMRGVADTAPESVMTTGRTSLFRYHREFARLGSYLPIQDTFERFHAGLSGNFKANLRKAKNKLEKREDVTFRYLRGHQIVSDSLKEFFDLEASGWKGRERSAILFRTELVRFYGTLAERLARRNSLELQFLMLGGVPIASHMAVRIGRSIHLVKIAYDERYSSLAPGNMLFLNLVDGAHRAGDTSEIDCLTDMSWHDNWRMKKRTYFDVYFFPKGPGSDVLECLPQKIIAVLKRLPGVRRMSRYIRRGVQS